MNRQEICERFEAALEQLEGDTTPARQVFEELLTYVEYLWEDTAALRAVLETGKADLNDLKMKHAGLKASVEGKMTALEAMIRNSDTDD